MMQGLLESLYKIYTDWRAPMTDESEAARRRPPPPPPRPSAQHGTQMSPQHGVQVGQHQSPRVGPQISHMNPQHNTQIGSQHVAQMSPQRSAPISPQYNAQIGSQHVAHMSPQHSAHISPQLKAQLAIQPVRPPEPKPRVQQPPRLIRPSEHLAIVERARERRAPPLTPTVAVVHGPRSSQTPHTSPSHSTAIVPHVPVIPPHTPSHSTAIVPHVPLPSHALLSQYSLPAPYVPPPPPALRPRAPPPMRMPAPVPPPVMRLPQPRKDNQAQPVSQAPVALPPPTSAPAPPAALCAAPRTIVIQRPDARHGFGFTLRHLVVYPPESLQELYEDARHLAVGAVGAPMDTIFVRSVRPGGPAAASGLRAGDRVLAVNGEPVACGRTRAPYARVVQLAQREPRTLRLTVVPRDHDLLQRYFSEAAYNPETNQRLDMPAPTSEAEPQRRPRASLPAPPRRDDPEYASVASLAPSRYLANTPHYMLHDGRRESDTSLPSSAAESKDSLGSFDSNSTLTGREIDDSIILSRIRKSLEQKEAFLRRPSQPTGWVTPDAPQPIKQKEFYARPQKLQKPAWPPPPSSPPLAASPPPSMQQSQEQSLKKEECSASVDSGTYSGYGEVNGTSADKNRPKQDKSQFVATLSKIQETAPSIQSTNAGTVPNGGANEAKIENQDETTTGNQDSRYPVPELQLVTARTRQLEEARGGARRIEVARSELARLSSARLEPSVALRRKEFEGRAARREARSLDVQPHQELEHDTTPLGGSLSGNQLMITGSKHLHCPPPEGYAPETEKVQMRTRSNSTGSEGLPIRRHHATDGSHAKRRMGLNREQMEEMSRVSLCAGAGRAARPTQLSLAPLSASTSAATSPSPTPTPSTPHDSGFADDLVTRRQKKEAQLGEEERAMRRVSYLKATWGDRLHLDSDLEPDSEHHALRSAYRKWRPPRFTDDITPLLRIFDPNATVPARPEKKGDEEAEEEGAAEAEHDVQGHVQIKMVVSNGKRASDRSWKQVWAVLHGTKLYLYRHHPSQSPGAASGAGAGAESGSRDALDVRYSLAALADDYTKRKHVVRVTTAAGAELLLQAEGAADAQRWLEALRRHSAEPPPAETAPAALGTSPAANTTAPSSAATPAPASVNSAASQPDCPSPLPPQRSKKITRNRSPTGPPTPTLPSSPKNKTWKGRMAKQLRRMQGGTGTGAAPGAPPPVTGWLGAPLERCPTDPEHPGVPLAVTLPATAVETYGLRTVGVYRVPGNAGGVATLAAALDRGNAPASDARWADVHVASSLLKAYLRRLPDPLLTHRLYPAFIAADRSADRARELRRLVHALPEAHYETLKYLMQHLRRVVAHSAHNKMEARNLAIVFGPTLVRAASDDMLAMVNDMSSQCRIIESLLTHYSWYFEESAGEPPAEAQCGDAPQPSRDLLIHNVKKIEGKDVSTRDIVSSIISAANRKIQRKPRTKPTSDKKWAESDKSPPSSPPHLTTSLADYDGLPRFADRAHDTADKIEIETMTALSRGRQEVTRHTHTLNNFSIDGTGDLVSSLTSTFDQKLRTLNNSSPLDDGSIPYADECQEDAEDKSSGSSPSLGHSAEEREDERASPSARAHQLKAAWLARDLRHSSSSSNEDEARHWPRRSHPEKPLDNDDSEKENCLDLRRPVDDDKDVDTRSQASSGDRPDAPDNDKRVPYYNGHRLTNPESVKRNSAALERELNAGERSDDDCAKLKRSESLNREQERSEARVLRSESLNCRAERLQRSESLNKGDRPSKLEKCEWNVARRRETGAWRSTKLKRKNGMPERGIKRRHTVGGTKDFDKDGWGARHTRTSSPDLSAPVPWPNNLVPPPRPPLESHV